MAPSGTDRGFISYIYDRYKDLKIKDICLVFEGIVTHQVMRAFTGLMVDKLDREEDDRVLRRLYHVMMESLHNINRHAEAFEYRGLPYPGHGVVLVVRNRERFQVTTGNLVDSTQVEQLSLFLGKLNAMDQDQLDDMYKKQLRKSDLSPEGSAGVGFIDIRRKTGIPLDYSFVKMDDGTSLFLFTSTIAR